MKEPVEAQPEKIIEKQTETYEEEKIIDAHYNFNRKFTQIPKYHKK
jgi:hypothetical protein